MVEFFWVFYGGTGLGLNVVGFWVCFLNMPVLQNQVEKQIEYEIGKGKWVRFKGPIWSCRFVYAKHGEAHGKGPGA